MGRLRATMRPEATANNIRVSGEVEGATGARPFRGMRQELWNELPHLGAMALCFFSFVVLLGNWIKPIVPRHRLSLARTRQLLLAVAVGSLMLLWLFLNPSVDGLDLGDSCAVYQRRSLEPPSFAKIIMSFTPNQASFAGLALQVNRRYAQRHGYRFQNHVGCAPRSRAPQWTKIALLLNELAARDAPRWVVWIDADAVSWCGCIRVFDAALAGVYRPRYLAGNGT